MKNSTKKWLTVAGCLVICAVLVGLIGARLRTEPPQDAPLPTESFQPGDVTVNPGGITQSETEKEPVVIPPDLSTPAPSGNGAVSSGAEQTIQGDVSKPEYTEDQLKDPAQKPNGDKVTEQDVPVDHEKVVQPSDPPKPQESSKPSGGGNSIPGFDNVPDGGANTVIEADDMYENGNKVGTMG